MAVVVQCKLCNKEFKTKPFFIKNGWGKYCSAKCHHEAMKSGEVVSCHSCEKKVYKTQKALRISKSKTYFCTKSCQTRWRNSVFIGTKHANWIDGKYSYRGVMKRNNIIPICNLCKTEDVRVLAVHHVDQNKKNNNVGNLMWLCHNCHHLAHYYDALEGRMEV